MAMAWRLEASGIAIASTCSGVIFINCCSIPCCEVLMAGAEGASRVAGGGVACTADGAGGGMRAGSACCAGADTTAWGTCGPSGSPKLWGGSGCGGDGPGMPE
eukprot:364789-Chlamydomonas_euryale.AAC.13